MLERKIRSLNPSRRADIADLVTRAPEPQMMGPSPFLLIAHHGPQVFQSDNLGMPFAPHPHRGFETVTLIRHGEVLHEDSHTGARVVGPGGVQWMTAGSGVVHNESASPEFRRNGGPFEILQLWLNLPARLKSSPPAYIGVDRADIPAIAHDGGRVTVNLVAGSFRDVTGPVASVTGAMLATVELAAGGTVSLPAPEGRIAFLYIVEGDVSIGGTLVPTHARIELDVKGDVVTISAASSAFIIYGHADPIEEPVAASGPFVMTTQAELIQAIHDYRSGAFQ